MYRATVSLSSFGQVNVTELSVLLSKAVYISFEIDFPYEYLKSAVIPIEYLVSASAIPGTPPPADTSILKSRRVQLQKN